MSKKAKTPLWKCVSLKGGMCAASPNDPTSNEGGAWLINNNIELETHSGNRKMANNSHSPTIISFGT
jgi:hypothetical protein